MQVISQCVIPMRPASTLFKLQIAARNYAIRRENHLKQQCGMQGEKWATGCHHEAN